MQSGGDPGFQRNQLVSCRTAYNNEVILNILFENLVLNVKVRSVCSQNYCHCHANHQMKGSESILRQAYESPKK